MMPSNSTTTSRRQMLKHFASGFGLLGLANLFSSDVIASSLIAPHIPAKAKRVIFLFMSGGPSHVDTFDPKPALARYAGQPLPRANLRTERRTGAAFPSPFKFQKHGRSGKRGRS